MNLERNLRKISDKLVEAPAGFLADRGIPANLITGLSFVTGFASEWLVFNNHQTEDRIMKLTGRRFTISAEVIKKVGVGGFIVSLYFDILDGKVARKSKNGPTKFGANADNFTDGAVETNIGREGLMSAKTAEESDIWERFLKKVRQPSTVRAAGEAHGVEISEIDIGARLARIPAEIGLLVSEQHRLKFAQLAILQAEASVIWRLITIARSGNTKALLEASTDLALQEILFAATRAGNPGTLKTNLISQGISVGFSALAKARRTLFSRG